MITYKSISSARRRRSSQSRLEGTAGSSSKLGDMIPPHGRVVKMSGFARSITMRDCLCRTIGSGLPIIRN